MDLYSYILAAILFWSPLHLSMQKHESPSDRLDRYQNIVDDIVDVVMDPNEKPLFNDKYGRERTALMIASIAYHESGFDKDVDQGTKRGDNGRSVCIMQVMTNMHNTRYNYSPEFLLSDRKNCIRAGLAIARSSNCPGTIHERFRNYTSGNCAKRDDPEKEKKIVKAARGLVEGYIRFNYSYPIKKYLPKST